ncbi:hypothetical protein GCM10009592_22920 [Brachybacterium rhamnosum]|uniref:Protein kinase family protein n=1 Tax=Brachybacterium rhamnosum TaxID=173361 RepID=A0ABW4Q2A8_9MICO
MQPSDDAAPSPTPVGHEPGVRGHGRRRSDGARAPRALPTQEDREETLLEDGRQGVRVRPLTAAGELRVREEMQLLAELELAGVRAAPAVLAVEEEGYLRELLAPVRAGTGRRSDPAGAPHTGEREALAAAREDLDELLAALHDRGWVLGAPPGTGLGRRASGGVAPIRLDGLRRSGSIGDRQLDRLWADSVLEDGDRTLRRRGPSRGWTDVEGARITGDAGDAGPAGDQVQEVPPEVPAPESAPAASPPWPGPVPAGALPLPAPRAAGGEHRARARSRAGLRHRTVDRVRRTARRRPRTLLAAVLAGAVLIGGCAVVGTRLAGTGTAGEVTADAPAAQAPDAAEITDALALATELGTARHAYVTGASGTSVAVPGSDAAAEDDALRAAYAGSEVHGGEPVVEEAALLAVEDGPGTASLRVVTSTPAHEVQEEDGTVRTVEATAPSVVVLHLEWTGTRWRIASAEAA